MLVHSWDWCELQLFLWATTFLCCRGRCNGAGTHQAGNARPGHIAAVDGSDGNLAQVIGGKCLSVFSVEVGVSAWGSECRAHGCIAKQKASRGGWRGRKWLTGLVRSLPHSHTSQPENVKKMAGMNIASPSFSCRLCIVTYNTDVGCGCGSCQTASPRLWPFFLLQHSLFLSCCRCWRSGIDSAWHYVDARRCLFRFGSHA